VGSRDPRAPTSDDVGRLDAAIDGVGIDPAFQPIVALPGGQVVGFEALARWPVLDDPQPQRVFVPTSARVRSPRSPTPVTTSG
jgi:sensor c-di-GMP phosphodiesterase-like protein